MENNQGRIEGEEDITDVIDEMRQQYTPENFEKMNIVVGRVLKFDYEGSKTTLKITRIEDGKYFAEHIYTTDMDTGFSHYGHIVESDKATQEKYGAAYCRDCECPTNEPATEEGDTKAYLRQQEADLKAKAEQEKSDGEQLK